MTQNAQDETTFTIPSSWRRAIHPRRDRGPRRAFTVSDKDVERAEQLVQTHRHTIDNVLADPRSEPALTAAAHAYLGGAPEPRGAAVVAAIVEADSDPRTSTPGVFAHQLIARHGVVFAAQAAAELSTVLACRTWTDLRTKWEWYLRHRGDDVDWEADWTLRPLAELVRSALAAADDDDYDEAVRALESCRSHPLQRMVTCYLVPTQQQWVDEFCTTGTFTKQLMDNCWMALCAVGSANQLAVLPHTEWLARSTGNRRRGVGVLYTLVEGVGPQVAPMLVTLLDSHEIDSDSRKLLLDVLSVLPTDEALSALLERASQQHVHPVLMSAMRRYPVRALRLLAHAAATDDSTAMRLLHSHLLAHPELIDAELPDHLRQAIEKVVTATARVPDALAAALPELLVRPPWTIKPAPVEPIVIEGLEPLVERSVMWQPGEREVALRLASGNPASNAGLLLPFADAEVARLMADWLVRLKSARGVAIEWFTRHAAAAARLLVPDAVGEPGTRRRNAEAALRLVISKTTVEDVLGVAASYGEDARRAIETLAATDPLEIVPATLSTIGSWAEPGLLPQVRLRDRRSALPREATVHLLTMLAISRPDEPYPGVAVVKELCDPTSLAEFAWALFQQWQAGGEVATDSWALTALGWLGDDVTVRRLSPVIRAWPGRGHAKASAGLDLLATIGSDIALMQLKSIAETLSSRQRAQRTLKWRAQEKIAAVAAERGLSSEQLADRLVPTFGLDDATTREIDYGSRRFVIGFDEELKPYVIDGAGKRRKDLPKPGALDDQELAHAEHTRFAAIKKDVRTVAADQIRRLETAMVTQRKWTATEFRTLLAGHPLLWHIVRRLVWLSDGGQGFRLAEDRTLADVNDDGFTLSEDAEVHIAHPLHLGDTLDAWSEIFADYEILQPFPQLGRPVHALTQDECDSTRLKRFEGVIVPAGRVLGLIKRRWRRGVSSFRGVERWILRPVPDGSAIVINLDSCVSPREEGLTTIWLDYGDDGDSSPRGSRTFGELDPVTASEVLAELTELTS